MTDGGSYATKVPEEPCETVAVWKSPVAGAKPFGGGPLEDIHDLAKNEGSRESKGPLCSSARAPRLDAEAKKRHRIASRMTLTVSSGWSHRGKWPLCSNQWIAAPGKAAMARFA